jgi:hypothetical protein
MKKLIPGLQHWIENLSPAEQEHAENLPLRRDMVTFLTYLRDHRVVGTQSTGNLPLKTIREMTAHFVHPPTLDATIGEHTYRLRSEDDVWPLLFVHLLANYGYLVEGGQAKRWRLTEDGEQFLQLPPAVQIAFLLGVWWKNMDWVVAFPYEGMSKGLPLHFKDATRKYLLEQPIGTRVPAETFADELITRTGLKWPAKVESAQTILRAAVDRMVVDVLEYFGLAEIEYRKDRYSTSVSSFKMTAFGRGLLETLKN